MPYEEPKYIGFNPWKGQNYEQSSFGKRILVLGESHYRWDKEIDLWSGLTQYCINQQISGKERHAFWTRIVKAFIGRAPNREEKEAFWHSVAFYNYVQFEVGLGARKRPTAQMWGQSEPHFVERLQELQPHLLLVLGHELWEHLPPLGGREEPSIRDSRWPDAWRYPLTGGGACLAFRVRHPSAGFNALYWHPFFIEALRRA